MPPQQQPFLPEPLAPLEFQQEMQLKAEANGRWNSEQSNRADLALCNNLMLLDTIALTATGVLISTSKTLSKATVVLLIIATVCIVVSIFCGIANFIMIKAFQERWSRVNAEIGQRFASNRMTATQMNMVALNGIANVPTKSHPVFFYSQIGFLSAALTLYLALVIAVLSSKL